MIAWLAKASPNTASPTFIWCATAIGLGIKLAFFAFVCREFYLTSVELHETSARNTAVMIEQDLLRNVEVYDLSLRAVIEGLANPRIMAQDPDVRHVALFSRSATAPGLAALVVLDKDGRLVHDWQSPESRTADFSDREFFKAHRNAAADIGLYISRPFKARLAENAWSISFSRRLSSQDGSFAGVVSGAVRLDYLRLRFDEVTLGEGSRITLFRDDGTMIVRDIANDERIGENWSRAPIFKHLPGHDSGQFYSENSMDGVPRWYAFRRVGNSQLAVSVGVAKADVLAPWRFKLGLLAGIYTLMAISIVGLAAAVVSELKRRMAAERTEALRARQDALTSLSNRLGFNERFETVWQACLESGGCLSLAMIDLDEFKLFNDTYGHVRGDHALQLVAASLAEACGPGDFAARIGGEEFAILLPGADETGAKRLLDTIRESIEAARIEHRLSANGVVTISAGLASITPQEGIDRDMMMGLADAALYTAKAKGRNCVQMATLSDTAPKPPNAVRRDSA